MQIDKEVPFPTFGFKHGSIGELIDAMEPGDSIFARKDEIQSLRARAHQIGKLRGRRFATRTVEGGARLWRLE